MAFDDTNTVLFWEDDSIQLPSPDVVIGIGDTYWARESQELVVTYSLGSCIGMTIYEPSSGAGAMGHFMLPTARNKSQSIYKTPGHYADEGSMMLLTKILSLGAKRDKLIIKIAGGGQMLDVIDTFSVGAKNTAIVKKVMEKNKLRIVSEDVGGDIPRTLYLDMKTGKTYLRSLRRVKEL